MDPMEAIKATFFVECEEQLAELEAGLMAMEAGTHDAEDGERGFPGGAFGQGRCRRFLAG